MLCRTAASLALVACACAGCGSAHTSTSNDSPSSVVRTTCSTLAGASSLPPGGLPTQGQIKQSGSNGGGCYHNVNSAHPRTP